MIKFKKLKKSVQEVNSLAKYFNQTNIKICDISAGTRYLWGNEYTVDYSIVNNTLIMKDTANYKNYFYYPLGENAQGALEEIEKYSLARYGELNFCCIDQATLEILKNRYFDIEYTYDRDWCDYIYNYQDFVTYFGKRFSGQRNHVNKFKNLYGNYLFRELTENDFSFIKSFIEKYQRQAMLSRWTAVQEDKNVLDFALNFSQLNQRAGGIFYGEELIALAIGEVIGDTLIVHVEKGLKEYNGVYPTLAQEFAKMFSGCELKYINREEDCGDMGLRTSKTQYHPIEIREKYLVKVKTLFDKITFPINLKTQRLAITELKPNDKEAYFKLYTDEELNKYWGYNYKRDLKGEPTPDYFYNFAQKLIKKKEEISLAVRLKEDESSYLGELVVYNFDFFGGLEIGYRFFSENQGKGYAFEGACALIDYLTKVVMAKKVGIRCYKKNFPSQKLIAKLGLTLYKKDRLKLYYQKNLI